MGSGPTQTGLTASLSVEYTLMKLLPRQVGIESIKLRKRICLISFSPVYRDGQVLRQIEHVLPPYKLTVVGYGTAPKYAIEWIPIDRRLTLIDKVAPLLRLIAGRLIPAIYDYRYWHRPHYAQALEMVGRHQYDAFHANEWAAVPIAVTVVAASDG